MRVFVAGTGALAEAVVEELRRQGHDAADDGPFDAALQLAAACPVPHAARITRLGGGLIYSPDDEVIAPLLKRVRTLPVVPVPDGDKPIRPIWFEDAAKALVVALERGMERVELAGPEQTTLHHVVERLRAITRRHVLTMPLPLVHKVEETPERDTLQQLGIEPTPLEAGLRKLADMLPEVLPEDGVGKLEHKKFSADIRGTKHTAASLMAIFRERITEVMPIEFAAEPDAPRRVELGVSLTAHLPIRGNIQVRVVDLTPTRVAFATIEGHPLAGIVEFLGEDRGDAVRFEIEIHARASNLLDFVALHTVGKPAQAANWRAVVQKMIDLSGGTSDGVHEEAEKLDDALAAEVERRVRRLVEQRPVNETRA